MRQLRRCCFSSALFLLLLFIFTTFCAFRRYNRSRSRLAAGSRVVCYLSTSSQDVEPPAKFDPSSLRPGLCSHIVVAHGRILRRQIVASAWRDESTALIRGLFERVLELRQADPSLRVLLSIGGPPADQSLAFSRLAADQQARTLFVQNVISFLRIRGFDGLDLDWRHLSGSGRSPRDREGFSRLLEDLRTKFEWEGRQRNRSRLLLSAVISPIAAHIRGSYQLSRISQLVDFINLRPLEDVGMLRENISFIHNALHSTSALLPFSQESSITMLRREGMPGYMINLAIPFFGLTFRLGQEEKSNPGDPAVSGIAGVYTEQRGLMAFYEVCQALEGGWLRKWLSTAQVPYLHRNRDWIVYEDVTSLQWKIRFAVSEGLGGVAVWSIDMDDVSASFCHSGSAPLLVTVRKLFQGYT